MNKMMGWQRLSTQSDRFSLSWDGLAGGGQSDLSEWSTATIPQAKNSCQNIIFNHVPLCHQRSLKKKSLMLQ